MKRVLIILAALGLLAGAGNVRADAIGLDVNPTQTAGFELWSAGWSFTLNQTVTIERLLMFDDDGDGFEDFVSVVIYNDNGFTNPAHMNLQTSFHGTAQAVYAGDTPSLGVWRERDIVDTQLGPGTYTIISGITHELDELGYSATISTAPGVTYNGSRSTVESDGLYVNPTGNAQVFMTSGIFGPNFAVFVPTPAAAWLAAPLLGAMIAMRRRRSA